MAEEDTGEDQTGPDKGAEPPTKPPKKESAEDVRPEADEPETSSETEGDGETESDEAETSSETESEAAAEPDETETASEAAAEPESGVEVESSSDVADATSGGGDDLVGRSIDADLSVDVDSADAELGGDEDAVSSEAEPEPEPEPVPEPAWLRRYGIWAVMLLGSAMMLWRLGASGLWEPWEMDRADLARTLVEQPRVPAALAPSAWEEGGFYATVESATLAENMLLQAESTASRTARGAASLRGIRETLDFARMHVVPALILDLESMRDDTGALDLQRLSPRVAEAVAYIPNGRVILIGKGIDPTQITQTLAELQVRDAYKEVTEKYGFSADVAQAALDQAIADVAGQLAVDPRLVVLDNPDSAALQAALAEAASATKWIVTFKESGDTLTAQPLETWAVATSFSLFGISEFSARLPGVIFALLALLALLIAARAAWGTRVAVIAGVVLLTTPLFFAQARSVVGEPTGILSLTLGAGAFILGHKHGFGRRTWFWLVAAMLVGFFGKGLFALMLVALVGLGYVVITATRERGALLSAGVAVAAFAILAPLVQGAEPASFMSQFSFSNVLFSDGIAAYDKNFDYLINQIGFGAFPWSPFYIVAMGGLIARAGMKNDGLSLVVVLWFAVPVVAHMLMMKSFDQLIWCGAPAGALAVALLLEQVRNARPAQSKVIAFIFVVAFIILLKELSDSPRSLAAFLAYDPPFTKTGSARFPESIELPGLVKLAGLAVAVLVTIYFTRFMDFAKKALDFFRRPKPMAIALGVAAILLTASWLARVMGAFAVGMKLPEARQLALEQRVWADNFFGSADPMVLLAHATASIAFMVLLLRFWPLRRFTTGLDGLMGRLRTPRATLVPLLVAGAAWAGLGVSMLFSVSAPEGYWGETLGHPSLAVVLGAACIAWLLAIRMEVGTRAATVFALGIVGLWLGTRLSRDASLTTWYSSFLTFTGFLGVLGVALPRMWKDAVGYSLIGLLGWAAGYLALAAPMLERWDTINVVLYGETAESLTLYLLTSSRLTFLFGGVIILLLANRFLPNLVDEVVRLMRVFHSGRVMAGIALAFGLLFTVTAVAGFYKDVAHNVSQKHIVETYEAAEGLSIRDPNGRIFKHGSFAARASRKDVNFYTAQIPEIRDRKTALRVLLGQEDLATRVETASGTDHVFIRGWDPKNDLNGDFVRDFPVEIGVATEVGDGRLVDATKSWQPGQHTGKLLADSRGKTWEITGNDATSLQLSGEGRPSFIKDNAASSAYAIDDPRAPNHRATANEALRYYLLLPAESFSSINHAFRKMSDGRHIPIIDSRSYRVYLATSWLAQGETQTNRFDEHTYTQQEWEELLRSDPDIIESWGNFEDKIMVLGHKLEEKVVSKGKNYKLTTYYKCLKDMRKSYQIFLHIDRSGASDRIHSDHWPLNLTEGGEDDKKCTGCYRTDHWLAGDIVADVYEKEVPIGHPSGPYDIWVGWWNPSGGARLKAKDWDKEKVRHDGTNRLRIGSLQVR